MNKDTLIDNIPILDFDQGIPLYCPQRSAFNDNIAELYQQSRNIKSVMNVQHMKVMLSPTPSATNMGYVFLDLKLYNSHDDSMFDEKVVMPNTWTPRMYLALCEVSVTRNKLLCIQQIELEGNTYMSINDLHFYFHYKCANQMYSLLLEKSQYFQKNQF